MVEETARVVVKSETYAWVEAERRTSCHACTVSQGCGTGFIAKHLIRKTIVVKASNPVGAEVGDRVIVGIPERILYLGPFVFYTVPLLVMFLGAGVGEALAQHWGGGESLVVLSGLGGLAAGLLGARYMQIERGFEPEVLRTVSKGNRESEPYSH
ncbi:SoxR reducing system RseC family protein [Nitrosococcus wardiae]|uniref:Fis family transcriptional regulator n=1 Tax=Nitrosococcus wardiae TaxID=1814290 RepID=A0A4P7BXK5_9GAMM|nr:SoxR reducing system RseC family protein [Nitrosococcus wardiae]QBQ53182.1 Fis family transcriptional regulator [Nitrosococcus wardiae]